ncbi:MAG: metallophosphoesterase family protein [Spirochaetales bacterium]|nr:metallophosphoesterase family protein [Spirochaetales bacterium]
MNNVIYSSMKDRLERLGTGLKLKSDSKIVIFSDLHMGDGSKNDDFLPYAGMFKSVLNDYYYDKGYTLILNGDVEELQKNSLDSIHSQWSSVYDIFNKFSAADRFYKIAGNHDSKLLSISKDKLKYPLLDALRLDYRGDEILVFHGHQFSIMYESFNELLGFFLRYFVKTLRIKNRSTAHNSNRRWVVEKRAYEFSRSSGIISILGHTHRPLFESLSKVDSLIYEIEKVCRQYVDQNEKPGGDVEARILSLKRELSQLQGRKKKEAFVSQLYSKGLVIPCLFNSGCVIGKRGMTAIEISGDKISLIVWTTHPRSVERDDFPDAHEVRHDRFPLPDNPDIRRRIVKRDDLRYIFTRINLLG